MKRFKLVLGIVIFSLLMGLRPEFESRWTRSLVAGIAGAILASCVISQMGHKQKKKNDPLNNVARPGR
jgi:hypothetical protein